MQAEAVALGELLVKQNLIHHVKDQAFRNGQGLFRFRVDDSDDGDDSAAALSGQCDTMSSYLHRKALLRWKKEFYVLQISESKLLVFSDEYQSKPSKSYALDAGALEVADQGLCRDNAYCFSLKVAGETLQLASGSSKEQEAWIELLLNAGATLEDTLLESKAKAIFEFEPLDIDGQPHALQRYSGRVCLVVNVASF